MIYLGVQSFLKYFKIRESSSFCFHFLNFLFWTTFIWSKWTHCSERDQLKQHGIVLWRFYLILTWYHLAISFSESIFTWSFWFMRINFQRGQWKKGGIAPPHRVWMICIGFPHCHNSFFILVVVKVGKGIACHTVGLSSDLWSNDHNIVFLSLKYYFLFC